MGNGDFKAEVKLKNQKVKFEGISLLNPTRHIDFDYAKPMGDDEGFRGLELLLLSFGGCVSTTIVFLIRRQGKEINSFKMNLEGVKKENPLSIEKINFEVEIDSEEITEEDIQVIAKQTEALSPVWNMIKGNCIVQGNYILRNKEAK